MKIPALSLAVAILWSLPGCLPDKLTSVWMSEGQEFMGEDRLDPDATAFDFSDVPWGLTTYANLPYFPCLTAKSSESAYDIAILGAPFDTVLDP
jgi:hypothetical protein